MRIVYVGGFDEVEVPYVENGTPKWFTVRNGEPAERAGREAARAGRHLARIASEGRAKD